MAYEGLIPVKIRIELRGIASEVHERLEAARADLEQYRTANPSGELLCGKEAAVRIFETLERSMIADFPFLKEFMNDSVTETVK